MTRLRPARPPRPTVHEGRTVRLEPLALSHGPGLCAGAHVGGGDPELFRYLPYGPFADEAAFREHLEALVAAPDALFSAIVDRATGRAGGHAALMRSMPQHGVIEVGNVLVTPALQRTTQATEAMFLLARHVFEDLGFRRLEWKCDAANTRSRRAAERFGFTYEGTFRQHMIVKGRNRDTAWFALVDGDWPAVRAAFEGWLDPSNVDAEGRQRRSLAEVRAAA